MQFSSSSSSSWLCATRRRRSRRPAMPIHATVTPAVLGFMPWLQLRFQFDSTAVRRLFEFLSKVIKVTVTVTRKPQSRRLIYLFRPQCNNTQAYGRNVGRRMVVARSNCRRMGVERRSNRSRFVVVATASFFVAHATSLVCTGRVENPCAARTRHKFNYDEPPSQTGLREFLRRLRQSSRGSSDYAAIQDDCGDCTRALTTRETVQLFSGSFIIARKIAE